MKTILQSKILQGILTANIFALIVVALQTYLSSQRDGVLIFSEFVIVPLTMGLITAWFWKSSDLKGKAVAGWSVINGFLAILLSFFFLGEGVICLLIVSPLILGFVITGAFVGKYLFKRKSQTLSVNFVGLLALIFIVDSFATHGHQQLVSDQIVIKATPDEIWQHVVAFAPIKQKENYWLFQIGMPSPMETTVSAQKLGANRKCIFSNGYVFDEKIVAFEENKNLTFDIIGQPEDPEIMGHIDIKRGQFLLKDNGDGTTTLIGNSWYKLHVFPTWYFDLWAESITRNVHLRVMDHIKKLSETK